MSKGSYVRPISDELLSVLGTGRQVAPFSRRYENFDLVEAYAIVAEVRHLREAKGERPVGRKVGFRNRTVWNNLGIASPMWNYVYDRTVVDGSSVTAAVRLKCLPEPRIEPEIVLHLCAEPSLPMSDRELLCSITASRRRTRSCPRFSLTGNSAKPTLRPHSGCTPASSLAPSRS